MKLLLERKWKKSDYTVGKLYVDGVFFCNTMEDADRMLTQDMSLQEIQLIKKANITAIPTGTYNINMNIVSPKYKLHAWYSRNCHGARLPRLENVPGYQGVLIHVGNTAKDSAGCILVGKNDVKGMVTKSKETFLELYKKMYGAYISGEKIEITIR